MIRVLLVHDECLMRSALAALLERELDLDVVAVPSAEAGQAARRLLPHVCVVDPEGPGATGLAAAAKVSACCGAYPGCALLVLVSAGRPGVLRRAYDADAQGYVGKDAHPDRLVEAIRLLAKGERYIDDSLALSFMDATRAPLTERELSVLSLAAEGLTVAEIARKLHLTSGTVRNYMAAITRKTGARNRVDAIRISQGAGWL
ncbi:LuxR C-terminal-related transcriptional regulator [Streptomyces boninensis]|uniref:response regulator transcription factor n=1 Tax=Streptomyces boninensis TaxID=2039455 RepID=UPI003B218FEF